MPPTNEGDINQSQDIFCKPRQWEPRRSSHQQGTSYRISCLTEFRDEPFLPKPPNLVRSTNLFRQKMRPKEPTDLSFELNTEYISEEFFREDIHINGRRHLVFSTPDQIKLLGKSKRLYVDATFKVVKAPFTQLFSIHGFIRHGESMKQVPLAYVLMSDKRKEDYVAVLEAINGLSRVVVVEVVMDFEVAMCQAVRAQSKSARGQFQLYLLIDLLHQEARYVEAQTKLVRDEQLKGYNMLSTEELTRPPTHYGRNLMRGPFQQWIY